jgi:hypothetical protein
MPSKLQDPIDGAFAITPHDTNPIVVPGDGRVMTGLYVGGQGDVVGYLPEDPTTAVTFTAMSAGVIHPIRFSRILATGTAATGLVGCY